MVEYRGSGRLNGKWVTVTNHAQEQMDARGIEWDDAFADASTGEIIETYPGDTEHSSELILGWVESRPLHVVLAYSEDGERVAVLTAYDPDAIRWHADFKRIRR